MQNKSKSKFSRTWPQFLFLVAFWIDQRGRELHCFCAFCGPHQVSSGKWYFEQTTYDKSNIAYPFTKPVTAIRLKVRSKPVRLHALSLPLVWLA